MAEDEDSSGGESAGETLCGLLKDDVYLNRISHGKELSRLEELLRVAAKEDATLLSSLEISNTSRPPYTLFLIIKITAAILASLPKPDTLPHGLNKVVDTQLFAFEELTKSGVKQKLIVKAKTLLLQSALRYPTLYLSPKNHVDLPAAYSVLIELDTEGDTLREEFVKAVVGNSTLDRRWLEALQLLVGRLKVEEYEKYIVPNLQKWLKAEGEQAIAVVQAVVKQRTFALGETTFRSCVPVLSKMLYTENDTAQEGAQSLPEIARQSLAALTEETDSAEVLVYILEDMHTILRGKGPQGKQAVAQAGPRGSVIKCLDCLACAVEEWVDFTREERGIKLSAEAVEVVGKKATSVILEQLKVESNQENVALLIHALARWCVGVNAKELPGDGLEVVLKSCFVEIEKRGPVLHGLELLCGSSVELLGQVVKAGLGLTCVEKESARKREEKTTVKKDKSKKAKSTKKSKKSDLSELDLEMAKPKPKSKSKSKSSSKAKSVKGGSSDQAKRNLVELLCRTINSCEFQKQAESVLTATAALALLNAFSSTEDSAVATVVDKEGVKLWNFMPRKSILLKLVHSLGSLRPDELEVISTERFDEWTRGRYLQESVVLVLARTVSVLVSGSQKPVIVKDEGFAYVFVYVLYFQHLLSRSGLGDLVSNFPVATLLEALKSVMTYVEKDVFVQSSSKRSTAYHRTLLSIMPNVTDKDFPLLVLLAHHPWARKTTWKTVGSVAHTKLDESNVDGLSSYLLEASTTKSDLVQQAACRSFGRVLSIRKRLAAIPQLVSKLQESLSMSTLEQLQSFSHRDLEVWRTPEGVLFDTRVAEEEPARKTVERSRNEDDEWERQVRAEIAEKKRAEKGEQTALTAAEIETRLTEEKQVRSTVELTRAPVVYALTLLSKIAEVEPVWMTRNIDTIHGLVAPFVWAPTISTEIQVLVKQLLTKSTLNATLTSRAYQLCEHAIQENSIALTESGKDCFSFLQITLKEVAVPPTLSPGPFQLVYPLLDRIIYYACHVDEEDAIKHEEKGDDDASDDEAEDDDEGEEEHPMVSLERSNSILHMHAALLSKSEQLFTRVVHLLLLAVDKAPQSTPAPEDVLVNICCATSLAQVPLRPLFSDDGLLSRNAEVRLAVTHCIKQNRLTFPDAPMPSEATYAVFFASCDEDEAVKSCALELASSLDLDSNFLDSYIHYLSHPYPHVRAQGGRGIALGLRHHVEQQEVVLKAMFKAYKDSMEKDKAAAEKLRDKSSLLIDSSREEALVKEREELVFPRSGVALTILACAGESGESMLLTADEVERAFSFVLSFGLKDENAEVRGCFLSAGAALVASYGEPMVASLLAIVNPFMSDSVSTSTQGDWQQEGAVVFLGSLARFLDKTDKQVVTAVDALLDALRTPSEAVQVAVTKCLPPLMKAPAVKEAVPGYFDKLIERATTAKSYGERRGAALGIAGIVKGVGISSLKKNDVIVRIEEAAKSEDSLRSREGALMTFESLCLTLGMIFEPYVIVLLPVLLECFADSKREVRDAARATGKAIMAKLSGHGVKLIMPILLKSLQDPAWRTKQAAIRLLGSMAYCAKKQLASCLPQIVPQLFEAFSDSHPKVRAAAKRALKEIGGVIQNPEIRSLVPVLMRALMNPHEKTGKAVAKLHRTRFVHMVDAPSLALIIPILHRGLRERSTDTKKRSALIVGNMCSMIADPKAVQPYLIDLMPILRQVLVDPIPGVRSTSAKAFGTLTRGLGEKLPDFPDLLKWLYETSRSDTSSVERSGGAQGLVEVLVALGNDRLETELHQNVLPLAKHPKPCVREGVLWVLIFLPQALTLEDNATLLGTEFPIIVTALADDDEPVRNVALRAGEIVVGLHALTHTNQLLPALLEGLESDNWRIRQSSVNLIGDLLLRIGGEAVKALAESAAAQKEDDEEDELGVADDEEGATASQVQGLDYSNVDAAIISALGKENWDKLLAKLYIMRSDTSSGVRQSALQVWKSVVPNTPRTLRRIIVTLVDTLVAALSLSGSGEEFEKKVVASQCLGEIVQKLGERVLPDILPILEHGFKSTDETVRNGACVGLVEIIRNASRGQMEVFLPVILPQVRSALCDESIRVREGASLGFNLLYSHVGAEHTINEIVPQLLVQLEDELNTSSPSAGVDKGLPPALDGLRLMIKMKSRQVLPFLLPKLLEPPIGSFQAKALTAVCEVSGSILHYNLREIMPSLIREIVSGNCDAKAAEGSQEACVWEAVVTVVKSVSDAGTRWLLDEIIKSTQSKDTKERQAGLLVLQAFVSSTENDLDEHVAPILKEAIQRFTDPSPEVVATAFEVFKTLTERMGPSEMLPHLGYIRNLIKSTASDARYRLKSPEDIKNYVMPALSLPKSVAPFVPLYQHALMHGSSEERESGAEAVGELVDLADLKALRPYVIKITGPLIRIVGDRFPPEVKLAIIRTLDKLLRKAGALLRPFLPQLQTSFVKSLSSTSTSVRVMASTALGQLVALSTRIEPLVKELNQTAASIPELSENPTVLDALWRVYDVKGAKVSTAGCEQSVQVLSEVASDLDENVREMGTNALAVVLKYLPEESQADQVEQLVVTPLLQASEWFEEHGSLLLFTHALNNVPASTLDLAATIPTVLSHASSDNTMVRQGAAGAAVTLLCTEGLELPSSTVPKLVTTLRSCLEDTQSEVKLEAVITLKACAKRLPSFALKRVESLLDVLVRVSKAEKSEDIKTQAGHCLFLLFQLQDGQDTMQGFLKTCKDGDLQRQLLEHSKRVLQKLDVDDF